jgi:hypothetical protein
VNLDKIARSLARSPHITTTTMMRPIQKTAEQNNLARKPKNNNANANAKNGSAIFEPISPVSDQAMPFRPILKKKTTTTTMTTDCPQEASACWYSRCKTFPTAAPNHQAAAGGVAGRADAKDNFAASTPKDIQLLHDTNNSYTSSTTADDDDECWSSTTSPSEISEDDAGDYSDYAFCAIGSLSAAAATQKSSPSSFSKLRRRRRQTDSFSDEAYDDDDDQHVSRTKKRKITHPQPAKNHQQHLHQYHQQEHQQEHKQEHQKQPVPASQQSVFDIVANQLHAFETLEVAKCTVGTRLAVAKANRARIEAENTATREALDLLAQSSVRRLYEEFKSKLVILNEHNAAELAKADREAKIKLAAADFEIASIQATEQAAMAVHLGKARASATIINYLKSFQAASPSVAKDAVEQRRQEL